MQMPSRGSTGRGIAIGEHCVAGTFAASASAGLANTKVVAMVGAAHGLGLVGDCESGSSPRSRSSKSVAHAMAMVMAIFLGSVCCIRRFVAMQRNGLSLAFSPLAAFSYSGTRPVLPRRLLVPS